MNTKNTILLVFLTFLYACQSNTTTDQSSLPSLYPPPKVTLLNISSGYQVNQLTQDSVQDIFNTAGKAAVTSKMIPFKSKKQPLITNNIEGSITTQRYKRFSNMFSVNPPIIDSLHQSLIKDTSHVLTNTLGDTLVTGKPIRISVNKKKLDFPTPVRALAAKFSQEALYDISTLGTSQNLGSNRIYDLEWGSDHSLWIATYAGLSHYNGSFYTHYTREQGLPNGNIRTVLEDSKGNIWFSPRGEGVCKYNGDSLMVLNHQDAILDDYIINITEDKQGNIWWGTKFGLTKYDGQAVTHYTTKEGMPSNVVNTIYADPKGRVWVGTQKGVVCFDNQKITKYATTKLKNISISAVLLDSKGNLWLGTNQQGILKCAQQQVMQYTTAQGLSDNAIRTIQEDKEGDIWVGTIAGSLNKFTKKYFVHYKAKDGLPENTILDILVDKQGVIWLATESAGIVKLKLGSFTFPNFNISNKGLKATAICGNNEGKVWIATENSGLLEVRETEVTQHIFGKLKGKLVISAMVVDKDSCLWIGTTQGVFKYQQGRLSHYAPDLYVLSLAHDNQGNLWIGTYEAGLWRYSNDQIFQYTDQDGLASNTVYSILNDAQGILWLGTNGGLAKFDGKRLFNYTTREGLSDNVVLSLFEDAKRQLWIGTYATGLMKFDGQKFTCYTTKEGLPSNLIASIIGDQQDNLWLSTDKGLVCLQKTDQLASSQSKPVMFNPMVYKNMKSTDFEFNSAYCDKGNNLWWGTNKVLVNKPVLKFTSSKARIPQVSLESMYIHEQFIDYRHLSDSLRKDLKFDSIPQFVNYPIKPVFSSHFNHLTFYFNGGAGVIKTDEVYYTYRIKELSKQWSKPSVEGVANYRNLPSGKFTLEAKARTKSQPWGKTFTYSFTIHPPWWQTWWFKTICLIGIVVVLGGGHYLRLQMLKKQQVVLEHTIAERTNELKVKNKELLVAKEREKSVLTEAAISRERRFLMVAQLLEEKYQKLQNIETVLGTVARKNNHLRLNEVNTELRQLVKSFKDIDVLTETLEARHPQLMAEVTAEFPHLSSNELKHCLLIRLNFSIKDAAQLLGVSDNAVRMARKRLIKKFELSEEVSLRQFLNQTRL